MSDNIRDAFEAWVHKEQFLDRVTIKEADFALKAWQASRKHSLEEAAVCAEGYPKYGAATAEEIRNLK